MREKIFPNHFVSLLTSFSWTWVLVIVKVFMNFDQTGSKFIGGRNWVELVRDVTVSIHQI